MDTVSALEIYHPLAFLLPVTCALLRSSNLVVHPTVSRIILHGSRGLAGGYRPDSDIDLSLIVENPPGLAPSGDEMLLHDVLETTLRHWQSPIELDLAAIFDMRACDLKCFDQTRWDEKLCAKGGVDCFGLYKTQKGFNGMVTNAGVQVKMMYPCLKIWQRISGLKAV